MKFALVRRAGGRGRCFALALLLILPALTACDRSKSKSGSGTIELTLAAYTTPREAYGKAIIPGFKRYWKRKTGQDVEVRTSYQGSGAQSRAIVGGFEADVAALSLAQDIDRIAEAGLITHDWTRSESRGMVSTSIVVIATRAGNPRGISDWKDLARPGLNVLTPDPRTSGGAMWNICAIYGAALRGHCGVPKEDPKAAGRFLESVLRNVSIMDKGARESITNFEKGIGDAALTYENEVLVSRMAGHSIDFVIPRSTILIENPVAVIDKYADKHGVRRVAEEFVQYLGTEESQTAFAKYGVRPVLAGETAGAGSQFRQVEDLWRIDYLGGWKTVTREIFGADGIYSSIFSNLHSR